jgi:Collagen triple helix repeat (20 copies)
MTCEKCKPRKCYCICIGTMGPIGLTGPTGTQGPIGLTGPTGTQGPIGPTGTMGPIGLTGPTGTQGPIGLTGPTGTMGPIGLTGATGTMGPIGLTGTMGPIGLTGPSISNNYTWGIKINTQTIVNSITFENIIFTSTPEINGWIYNSITGLFTCNQTGKYFVSYIVIMSSIGGSRVASIRGVINNIEIIGSANTQNFQSASINQEWTNSFIMNVNSGQTFSLQFAGSSAGNEMINFTTPIAGETPISSSITIIRIV